MIEILSKRLNRETVYDLFYTLDPMFYKRLEETINVSVYSQKLAEHAEFLIAYISDEVVGIIAFYENEKQLYIPYVCVNVKKRRLGIASLLLDSFCAYADSIGKPISLEVRILNVGAIKLYEKYGFEIKSDNGTKFYMTRESVKCANN